MLDMRFEDFAYFPALRARQAEMRALTEMDDERLDQILPMMTLGGWVPAQETRRAVDRIGDLMRGRPYLLNVGSPHQPAGDSVAPLFDPAQAFLAWRSFVGDLEGAIPVMQFETRGDRRALVRQAVLVERVLGRLAFRVRHPETEIEQVLGALHALDDTDNAVVYLDCGYLRGALFESWRVLTQALIRLRMAYPDLIVVMLGTSFPASVQQFSLSALGPMGAMGTMGTMGTGGAQRGVLEIQERSLHARLGGNALVAYGDYGALHPQPRPTADGSDWTARIDYPKETSWVFHRRLNDQSRAGYAMVASALMASEPGMGELDCWGERMIVEAAQGEVFARGPAAWLAVRINIHLARQVELSMRPSPARIIGGRGQEPLEWHECGVEDLLEA
ncbi:beta family protein [Roseateles amylovorans]|uniref:Beta family protein n=1 Tax=Roseateles amylovorans TaxID=2978473 RepID=A0ABY6BAJ7_9BURK|nr:beta family protein [Roseateles amylovorans]UXH80600.1 beta family protein [Roseateles amylovorans]